MLQYLKLILKCFDNIFESSYAYNLDTFMFDLIFCNLFNILAMKKYCKRNVTISR